MTSKLHPEEELLLQRVADGDEIAFRELYDRYREKIYSFAVQLTKSEDKADEIVQEVFMKLWANRNSLQHVQHFSGWLHRIARNLFIDALRKIAREQVARKELLYLKQDSTAVSPDLLQNKELANALQQALGKLSPQQRTIFEMSRIQGMKRDEIARELKLSENTVKVHLTRALNSIREYLSTYHHSGLLVLLLMFLAEKNIQ
ncbi:MAG: RNA polymerase sigma factor [Pseudobacter sp.]|uniref:RNA polymerase sigma factor n=1 Tax=Pseudobacter sp. TaxID=2045420 RepID=UPI003F80CE02